MKFPNTLLVVTGPTACGKTALSIQLANTLHTEIINADSRQFYKELSIGTARPTEKELMQAPHHFVGHKSVIDTYSAGDFESDVLSILPGLFAKHPVVILTGGSGMYIDAVCNGLSPLPETDAKIRSEVIQQYQKEGILYLQKEVQLRDPDYYTVVDTQNPQRLMRALEVMIQSGRPFSEWLTRKPEPRAFNILTIGIERDRNELYTRINQRVDRMLEEGLEAEARQNIAYRNTYALRTVGYAEFFDYFDGTTDYTTTVSLIKQHTRNFAKRQLTWFRRNKETFWFDARHESEIFAFLKNHLIQ